MMWKMHWKGAAKAFRSFLQMSWMYRVVPPESIQDTSKAVDTISTSTESYVTKVTAIPNRIPATALQVKRVKKPKPKRNLSDAQKISGQALQPSGSGKADPRGNRG